MGVGPARIWNDEDPRRSKAHVLKSERKVGVSDQLPVDMSIPGHSMKTRDARPVLLNLFEQRADAGCKFPRSEIRGARRRALDEIGEADAVAKEIPIVLGTERLESEAVPRTHGQSGT